MKGSPMPDTDQTPIAELFARNPLELGDRDIAQMVTYYRDRRKRYVLGDMQAGASKPKKKSAKAIALEEAKKVAGALDISDLL